MDKQTVLTKIQQLGLLAVIRGPSPELTVQMVEALIAGGVRGIEITYTTPQAEQVTAELSRRWGEQILLGMGTLTEPAQAATAVAAGAQFLVSPVCEPALVTAMTQTDRLTMAGALTPTEILQAWRLGADVIKLFPGSLTGPGYVRAIKGPFPDIPLMPTGGVSAANLAEWFAAGVIAVGAGSELCPPALARQGRFDEITRRAAEFMQAVQAARAANQ